ncbi:MAG TPA: ABC transporter permease [Candidatus Mucispirillum faecigallinarum]|uniref:ABC transporter permease n=1 Tax=Candidatus Mucispirillum faecigallinarum TaxID=2838699 RepID=A0A9D2GTI0_9BACT|nr:ABC transporter permease [Candidatus Mucispirillum faecigallinarum]
MKNISSILRLEYRRIIFDMLSITIIFVGSAFYSFYYPFPYENDIVRKMPVAVVDLDKSDLSKTVVTMLNNTESLRVLSYPSMEEAKKGIYLREVYGIIYIPDKFYKKVAKGESPTVSVFADGSYFILYSTALTAATQIVLMTAAGVKIQKMSMMGIPINDALLLQSAVNLTAKPLFNPKAGYVGFVAPAIYAIIVQQILLMVILLVHATGYERGYGYPEDASTLTILFSKIIVYLTVYMVVFSFFFTAGPMAFGIQLNNSLIEAVMFAIPYGFAIIFFGITLSVFARDRDAVLLVMLMTSIPFVMLAGFIWPDWMMPDWIRYFSYLIPSTPGVSGFLYIRQMGADISDVMPKYINLWIQVAVYGVTAFLAVRWQQKQRQFIF